MRKSSSDFTFDDVDQVEPSDVFVLNEYSHAPGHVIPLKVPKYSKIMNLIVKFLLQKEEILTLLFLRFLWNRIKEINLKL